MAEAKRPLAFCSFCGKSQHEVRRMIAGPRDIAICNECIDLCTDILDDKYLASTTISRRLAEEIEDTREDTGV